MNIENVVSKYTLKIPVGMLPGSIYTKKFTYKLNEFSKPEHLEKKIKHAL